MLRLARISFKADLFLFFPLVSIGRFRPGQIQLHPEALPDEQHVRGVCGQRAVPPVPGPRPGQLPALPPGGPVQRSPAW